MLKKQLFKCRIKLLFNYIKTAILFEFGYLWLFSPCFAVVSISKVPVLGWVLGLQFLIMFYFNLSKLGGLTDEWFKKLETERNELHYAIGILYWENKEKRINKKG